MVREGVLMNMDIKKIYTILNCILWANLASLVLLFILILK